MRPEVMAASVSGGVRCVECGEPASDSTTGWKAYLAGGFEDEPVEVVVFCPECALREVGTGAALGHSLRRDGTEAGEAHRVSRNRPMRGR